MGCTQSHSEIPRPPYYLQRDPQPFDAVVIQIAKIQNHEDYGVWRNVFPQTYEQQKETIWLWFNRVLNEEEKTVQIDLENFKRGTIEDMPDKGRVLYNVTIPAVFPYAYLQRYANDGNEEYRGLLQISPEEDLHPNECDDFYVHHPAHRRKLQAHITGKLLPDCIITKWVSKQRIVLEDGTEGRNVAIFGEEAHPVLDVQIRGTIVTSYVEEPSIVKEIEHTMLKKGSRYSMSLTEAEPVFTNVTERLQTEFVDIVEVRLLAPTAPTPANSESPVPETEPKVLAEWAVRGDSYHSGENKEVTFETPLFTLTLPNGWLNLFDFQVQIKDNVSIDAAMVMMMGYLHGAEFSVEQLKKAVQIPTPDSPPSSVGMLASDKGGTFGLPPDEVVGGGTPTNTIPTEVEDNYLLVKKGSHNSKESNNKEVEALEEDSEKNGVANLELHYYDGEEEEKVRYKED